jgi:hypothetical protein
MSNVEAWWTGLSDIWRNVLALAAVFALGLTVASASGQQLELPARVGALEAATDTTLPRRVAELEAWRAAEMVGTRYLVCRGDREDQGLDPADCRLILQGHEAMFSPLRGTR